MIYVNRENNKTTGAGKNSFSQTAVPKRAVLGKKKTALSAVLFSLLFFLLLLMYPSQASKGTLCGIELCANTLLPSLFPFMFVSALFSSGAAMGGKHKRLDSVFNRLFGIDFTCVQALFLGAFGGYPVGAVTVSGLRKKGVLSQKQAEMMIYIAFGSGMGFLVSYTGANLLSSREAGILLFSAQLITIFTMVILSKLIFGKLYGGCTDKKILPEQNNNAHSNMDWEEKNLFSLIFQSALAAGNSAFSMCLMVILFSGVSGVIMPIIQSSPFLNLIFPAFWEVSGGVKIFAGSSPLWFLGVITGFGGICVHMQVYFAAKDISFSKALFFAFRVVQGAVNGLAVFILAELFPPEEKTAGVFSSVTEKPSAAAVESPVKLIILVLVCFCFLFSLGQKLIQPNPLTIIKEKLNFSRR